MDQNTQVGAFIEARDPELVGEAATLLLAYADMGDETGMAEVMSALMAEPIAFGQVVVTWYYMCEAARDKKLVREVAHETATHLGRQEKGSPEHVAGELMEHLAAGHLGSFCKDWPVDSPDLPMIAAQFLGLAKGLLNEDKHE